MDAASNNGVDDIRAIREEVSFLPTKAKYRVYIIDEVHMLSSGAFNALLKTLEEPPEHVKFILATTEPQKLPATILSRCQRFDFKKIPNADIIKRLKIVCSESELEYTEDALKLIAELSEGAMRDALSILERCTQDGENKIDSQKIKELIGIPEITYIYGMVKAIATKDVSQALEITTKVLDEGKDLNNFIWEIIKYARDVLVYKTSKILEAYSDNERKQIEELAKSISKEQLIEIIYSLSELERELKITTQKTIMFQANIIRMCAEKEVEVIRPKAKLEPKPQKEAIQPKVKKPEQNVSVKQTSSIPTSDNFWPEVIKELKAKGKIVLCTHLAGTKAKQLNDMIVGIYFPNEINPFGKSVLNKLENKKILADTISMKLGKVMEIKYIEPESKEKVTKEKKSAASAIQQIAKDNDIPFNIID